MWGGGVWWGAPRWMALSEEAPSVSMVMLGPFMPRQKLKRFELMDAAPPVAPETSATMPKIVAPLPRYTPPREFISLP